MNLHRISLFIVSLLTACLSVSCGGGGDGSPSSIAVRFDPPALDVAMLAGSTSNQSITATLSSLPPGDVFPMIVDDKGVLQSVPVTVFRNANGTFGATLVFRAQPPLTTLTGNLALRLCKDSACSAEHSLTGASLGYTVTVQPRISIAVESGGVALVPDSPFGNLNYGVASGEVLTFRANIPVIWFSGVNLISSSITNVSTTTTSMTLTFNADMSQTAVISGRARNNESNSATAMLTVVR